MYELAPSVYAADYLRLREQIDIIEQRGAGYLHIDIMDGHFVPGLSFGPDIVAALHSCCGLTLDVHLMVEEPKKFIREFSMAGADIITVHAESEENSAELLDLIHMNGKRAGIVLKPSTPVEILTQEIWDRIDVIQIMTVEPGLKGQKFIPASYKKIRKTREMINSLTGKNSEKKIALEVDGDITPLNLAHILTAGANVIVAGKGLFAGNLPANIDAYLGLLKKGEQGAILNWN